jgi:hypothetical protein
MTRYRKLSAIVAGLLGSTMTWSEQASALDLNGAWASDADNCKQVFTRKGNRWAFSENSDVYGSGFIIEGDQIVGKSGRCQIKVRKDNGSQTNLIAACASDIMSQSMQFSLKEVDANTVTRVFPGMDGMDINFSRCPAQ